MSDCMCSCKTRPGLISYAACVSVLIHVDRKAFTSQCMNILRNFDECTSISLNAEEVAPPLSGLYLISIA